jgi:hypothetical protein
MIAGMFVAIVVCSAVMLADALPVHARLTVGGVQLAVAWAWAWQLAWQSTFALQLGGVIVPSHVGAVTATEHPPLQLAEHMTLAPPVSVQFPVHPPVQVPAQVPPLAPVEQVPVQLPEQVPWHCTEGAVPGVASHSPVQSAEQEPWQLRTGALAVASHVPVQEAEHVPESSPGVQFAVTVGGVQLAPPLQFASQLPWTLALTEHPPPETASPHDTVAEALAPPSSLAVPFRAAVIAPDAAVHAALTWVSSELPPEPPSSLLAADHVLVTPMSVAMFVQAVRTAFSMLFVTLTRSAVACTKACVLPSSDSVETCEGNWLHPLAAAAAVAAALQPFDIAISPTQPTSVATGTYLKPLNLAMGSSLLGGTP